MVVSFHSWSRLFNERSLMFVQFHSSSLVICLHSFAPSFLIDLLKVQFTLIHVHWSSFRFIRSTSGQFALLSFPVNCFHYWPSTIFHVHYSASGVIRISPHLIVFVSFHSWCFLFLPYWSCSMFTNVLIHADKIYLTICMYLLLSFMLFAWQWLIFTCFSFMLFLLTRWLMIIQLILWTC